MMTTEKITPSEPIGNSHIKLNYELSFALAILYISLAIVGVHAAIGYINILQGVH